MTQPRQIVAFGGGGFSMEAGNPLLDDYVLGLAAATGGERPKVCFLPTASGDADHYVVRFYRHFAASRCEPSHLSLFRRDCGTDDLRAHLLAQDLDLRRRRQRHLPDGRAPGAPARRGAARGVGSGRRHVRAQRGLAVLVQGGDDGLPRQVAADRGHRPDPGVERRALRQGGRPPARVPPGGRRRHAGRLRRRRRRRAALRRRVARARRLLATRRPGVPGRRSRRRGGRAAAGRDYLGAAPVAEPALAA